MGLTCFDYYDQHNEACRVCSVRVRDDIRVKGVALEPWRMIWLTMKPMGRERERGIVVARL